MFFWLSMIVGALSLKHYVFPNATTNSTQNEKLSPLPITNFASESSSSSGSGLSIQHSSDLVTQPMPMSMMISQGVSSERHSSTVQENSFERATPVTHTSLLHKIKLIETTTSSETLSSTPFTIGYSGESHVGDVSTSTSGIGLIDTTTNSLTLSTSASFTITQSNEFGASGYGNLFKTTSTRGSHLQSIVSSASIIQPFNGDAALFGAQSQHFQLSSIKIAVPIATGALSCGLLAAYLATKYGRGRRRRVIQISGPKTAQNSLGWN
jgi:hypothetical protein